MIEFDALAMKTDMNELYTIFLLKKNVQQDIIKIILGYSPIVVLELLKEWKVAIILVGEGYESIEGRNNYKTSTETIYSRQGQPIDLGKSNENFKEGESKCFNCNKYRYMAKKYWKKKEKETRKCFKCNKEGHIAKDCKGK